MNLFFLILLIGLALIIGVLINLLLDPPLPAHTKEVIQDIAKNGIPELVNGQTGYVENNGVRIWYETLGDSNAPKGTVFLINGFTEPSTMWNLSFLYAILREGYRVIRFDNRSVGLSDWMPGWTRENAYSMEDMIQDALRLIEHHGIEKVHIVGYSMGGYIAQRIALEYPEKVLSLALIASSSDLRHREHPRFDWAPRPVVKLAIRSRLISSDANFLKFFLTFMTVLEGQPLPFEDLKLIGEMGLYEIHHRKGFNRKAARQQLAAIKKARSCCDDLEKLDVPTLSVHGKNDGVLSFERAKTYAARIRNSKNVWIDDGGHVLTDGYVKQFLPEFLEMLAARHIKE